ncbi:MAG: F0F1 ATP synthase subunit A [Firmicutes bacterium]|nr:F0F1 ATP synthase subunit A [Bacillota bacterium]MCM1400644.1 F0F1 ATP synthase subunit A [Bacteroides sp.]MCM1476335.1 F0F1 ATP synthase subunit A [Bacteroides sp.]
MNKFLKVFMCLLAVVITAPAAFASTSADEEKMSPKDIIFEHLGDGYGWEVPFDHHHRIPLPVILFGKDGFHCFSSARVTSGQKYVDGDCTFFIPKDGDYKGKVVQQLADGSVYRPWDISITKNVCELFIACLLVIWSVFSVAKWHRREMYKAPRKIRGALEALIVFIYDGVIRPTLGDRSPKFAPFLLTVFFFILYLNLLGLMVVFPGGANLTGNIAVTLVLSVFTFLATNLFGTKHYWKEIFWPDVPLWLKFPIPIMPIIELFGVFTKPAALTVRLFANMMGGHMIVIVLTLLIFIFASLGPVVTGATTVVSILFSIFMLLIDVLVSFIQAYVFTMLSTLFISFGTEKGHEEHAQPHGEPVKAQA